jgi:hypothetical protein
MSSVPNASLAASPDPRPLARASASVTVYTLVEFVRRLVHLQPPPAYRLSLDSGIEYKNIRRAFDHPLASRLDTWQKLLRSLRVHLVAAASPEDVIWPGDATRVVRFVPEAKALPSVADAVDLRAYRLERGWSRRELARRAGVGIDAVTCLESGRGTVGSLVRVCGAHGLQLLLALPPGHATLEELWEVRAHGCLSEPAQYPSARVPRPEPPRSAPASHRPRQSPAVKSG